MTTDLKQKIKNLNELNNWFKDNVLKHVNLYFNESMKKTPNNDDAIKQYKDHATKLYTEFKTKIDGLTSTPTTSNTEMLYQDAKRVLQEYDTNFIQKLNRVRDNTVRLTNGSFLNEDLMHKNDDELAKNKSNVKKIISEATKFRNRYVKSAVQKYIDSLAQPDSLAQTASLAPLQNTSPIPLPPPQTDSRTPLQNTSQPIPHLTPPQNTSQPLPPPHLAPLQNTSQPIPLPPQNTSQPIPLPPQNTSQPIPPQTASRTPPLPPEQKYYVFQVGKLNIRPLNDEETEYFKKINMSPKNTIFKNETDTVQKFNNNQFRYKVNDTYYEIVQDDEQTVKNLANDLRGLNTVQNLGYQNKPDVEFSLKNRPPISILKKSKGGKTKHKKQKNKSSFTKRER